MQRQIKLVETVDTIEGAWTFIMGVLDEVGSDPDIRIQPIWVGDMHSDIGRLPRQFEVTVKGIVEE